MLSSGFIEVRDSTTKWLRDKFNHSQAYAEFIPKNTVIQPEDSPELPPKSKNRSAYLVREQENIRCFHEIYTAIKNNKLFYLKENAPDSPMSELEAIGRAYFALLAPGHCPTSATPVYNNEGKFTAICVAAIYLFASVMKAPFSKEDFKIEVIDNQLMTIPMLNKLDKWAKENRIDLNLLVKMKELQISEWTELESEENKDQIEIKNQIKILENWFAQEGLHSSDIDTISQLVKNIAKDLIHFRYCKGFGITLAASGILQEDDLHRGNIGRGIIDPETMAEEILRIDFDMVLWDVFYFLKPIGHVDKIARNPSSRVLFRAPTGRFIITANDIKRQPHTEDSQPFYSPTKGISNSFLEYFATILPGWIIEYFVKNAFTPEDNAAFSTLEHNAVHNYFKFKTQLRFILTNPDMYRTINKLYSRSSLKHQDKSLSDVLVELMRERIKKSREELFKLEEFKQFLRDYGQEVKKEIIDEFRESNKIYAKKAEKQPIYKELLVNLNTLSEKCDKLIQFADKEHIVNAFDPAEMQQALSMSLRNH